MDYSDIYVTNQHHKHMDHNLFMALWAIENDRKLTWSLRKIKSEEYLTTLIVSKKKVEEKRFEAIGKTPEESKSNTAKIAYNNYK